MPAYQRAEELIPTIGYIRVSLAREEMISPELQRAAIVQWAARTGHRIIDWVEDLDKTGRNFKRKIMRVIERVEAGEAKVIAVWKYSRFGRNRTGIEINLARIEQVGGQLISATEEVDATTATGWFQRDVIFSVAAFESKRAGEQWREAQEWRREQGLPATGGQRFGYIWQPRKVYAPDGTVTLQEERYDPDPALADTVESLYKRYVSGTGFAALAATLNAASIGTVAGNDWSNASLRVFMDSGFAAGYLRVHDPACKEPQYSSSCPAHSYVKHPERPHAAIISEELWGQYLARRDFTRTAPPRSRTASHPLAALARCGLCSAAARRAAKGDYAYLVCNTRSRKGTSACEGFGGVPSDVANAAVLEWLVGITKEVEEEARTRKAGSAILKPAPSPEQLRAAAEKEVARLERAVAKHMRTYAMSEVEDPDGSLEKEYLATLAELRAEKATAAQKVAEVAGVSPEAQLATRRLVAVSVAVGIIEEWDSWRPDRINAMLRQVIKRVDLHPGRTVDVVPAWAED